MASITTAVAPSPVIMAAPATTSSFVATAPSMYVPSAVETVLVTSTFVSLVATREVAMPSLVAIAVYATSPPACNCLAMSALKSMYDDGRLHRDVAEKIGYLDSGDPVRLRASPYWRCREFEPRKGPRR